MPRTTRENLDNLDTGHPLRCIRSQMYILLIYQSHTTGWLCVIYN